MVNSSKFWANNGIISWREAHSSTGRLVTGWDRSGAENKIEHNSLNFRARSPKFCMQVDLDRPQPFPNKLQKYKKYISTKVLITQPFFELQTPDFA